MVIRVGINGFGRVGRIVFRTCLERHDFAVSAINDPAIDVEYICYLVKFDSTHGTLKSTVTHSGNEIRINDIPIKVFHQKNPSSIPWETVGVQYVIEASGMFTTLEKASGHLASANIKRVIVTAPSADVPMVVLGVNDYRIQAEQKVVSCGSSTLYCLAPIIKVLEDKFGVDDGLVTSIHAMTPSLKPLDGLCLKGKHWRDHRSIHQNIIPASTGACKALGKIIPSVRDKLGGLAFRVPIVNVSVLDICIRLKRDTSLLEIVRVVDDEGKSSPHNIIKISNEETVSSDFIGDKHSCVLDVNSCLELKPNYYKLICWYENEYSYACRVVDLIYFSERQLCQSDLKTKTTYVRSRVSKKQDSVIQTEICPIEQSPLLKELSFQFSPKILNSSSATPSFKAKRPLVLRKQFMPNTDITQTNRSPGKKVELFKVWNDDTKINNTLRVNNRNSLFQSCFTISSKKIRQMECSKTQERLEKVKQDFSKMVNITEDLLRKSFSNRFQLDNISETKNDVILDDKDNKLKPIDAGNSSKKTLYTQQKLQEGEVIDISGDGSTELQNDVCKYIRSDNTASDRDERITTNSKEGSHDNSSCYLIEKGSLNCKIHVNKVASGLKFLSHVRLPCKDNTIKLNFKCNTRSPLNATNNNIAETVPEEMDMTVKLNNIVTENLETENISVMARIPAISMENNKTGKARIKVVKADCTRTLLRKKSSEENTVEAPEKVRCDVVSKTMDLSDDFVKIEKKSFDVFRSRSQINITERKPSDRNINEASQIKVEEGVLNVNTDIPRNTNVFRENKNETQQKNCINILSKPKDLSQGDKFDELHKEKEEHCNAKTNKTNDSEMVENEVQQYEVDYEIAVPEWKQFGNFRTDTVSRCSSPNNTSTTISQDVNRYKPDLYDKLDSLSGTDSDTSFQVRGKKSQIINLADLTTSLEDLGRLDKFCRICEISDELSDKLLSKLDSGDDTSPKAAKKWSFKDLCDKIKLDEFCNKVFGKN